MGERGAKRAGRGLEREIRDLCWRMPEDEDAGVGLQRARSSPASGWERPLDGVLSRR